MAACAPDTPGPFVHDVAQGVGLPLRATDLARVEHWGVLANAHAGSLPDFPVSTQLLAHVADTRQCVLELATTIAAQAQVYSHVPEAQPQLLASSLARALALAGVGGDSELLEFTPSEVRTSGAPAC